jgi:hypothetical protein
MLEGGFHGVHRMFRLRHLLTIDARMHPSSVRQGRYYNVRGRKGEMNMSYGLYVVGFVIVIGGLIYGAVLVHMPMQWIIVGSVVLLGIAIASGVKATRQKDPS